MNYIYDIYINGSRSFNNKFEEISTISEKYECEKNSIDFFNEKFDDVNIVIPSTLKKNIYTVSVFKVANNSYVTLININIDELKKYYDKHKLIPNHSFLSNVCKFHMLYTNNNYLKDYEKHIIDKVIVPIFDITEQPIKEIDFLNKDIVLRGYQKKSIKWMCDLEKNNNIVHYNDKFKYLLDIGDTFSFNVLTKEITTKSFNKSISFKGGALIDDIGNGKTLQAIILSILNYAKDISLIKNNMFNSRATLVLSPNHISKQWVREIKNMISIKLKIINILDKTDYENCTYMDLLDADFVFVSHEFLGNQRFISKYADKISTIKSYYKSSHLWEKNKVQKLFDEISLNTVSKATSLFETEPFIPIIMWHRIIVDEFHEIFTVPKYTHVRNILPHFKGNHKWILTGTPFGEHNMLTNILKYITDYNKSLDIAVPEIRQYVCENIFRRNLKDFEPVVKEKIIWLQLTFVEKMMYNAYRNDHSLVNNEILRQICCHPKIADDIKIILNECKTLKDIETSMVKHYEEQYILYKNKVDTYQKYIAKTQRCITLFEYREQKKLLIKEGYKVSIEKIPDIVIENNDTELLNILDIQSDSDTELEQKTNSDKKIIINQSNQKEIIKILGNKLDYPPVFKKVELFELLDRHNENLINFTKLMEGKKSSYTYFKTVVDKIKQIIDKTVEENCCICLSEIVEDNIGITQCGHLFCYSCLKMSIDTAFKCPLCKKIQSKKDISMISYDKKETGNTLIDNVGTKLAKLIQFLKSTDEHSIIFSQWDILLEKVGETLDQHGIKNVFCKGHIYRKDKAIIDFTNNEDIKVIMLSSKNAASGINLTKASKIIFLDPVSGPYEYRKNTELQAIGRAVRLGQTKTVEIVRFMIRDTIEEEIYNENKQNDILNKIYNDNIEEIDN
jgi:SNF2 family DNA or RNA helicase